MSSEHRVIVVPIKLNPHIGSDNLSIIPVFDSYQCVGNTAAWAGKTLGAFIPPDNKVPISHPEFAFLYDKVKNDGYAVIKAIRLRKELSYGLLVPVPDWAKEGDDLTDHFGVIPYEKPEQGEPGAPKDKSLTFGGETEKGPESPYYDLESANKFGKRMFEGREVVVHEKMEGENACFSFQNERMWCKSRNHWKREYPTFKDWTRETLIGKGVAEEKVDEVLKKMENESKRRSSWWFTLDCVPEIEKFCRKYPNYLLFGEKVGGNPKFPYNVPKGKLGFFAFDVVNPEGKYLDYDEARSMADSVSLPWAPEVFRGSFDMELILNLSTGNSSVNPSHIKEGIVIRTLTEENDPKVGRKVLKLVSAEYLTGKKK